MTELQPASGADHSLRRFLTVRHASQVYAVPVEEITEVIRVPAVARVPFGPPGLLGLANLRGSVLPIARLDTLLGHAPGGIGMSARAIVLSGLAEVALLVDGVEALVSVETGRIETEQTMIAAEPGERLRGGFRGADDEPVVKILDIQTLLARAFASRPPSVPRGSRAQHEPEDERADEAIDVARLVSFEVAGQEYAIGVDAVREIVPVPPAIASLPRSEALVLGVAAYRDTLLPLFSLRGLLGFPAAADLGGRVIVVVVGGILVGLVADRMRAIVAADPARIEPTPAILLARAGGETRIQAIYREEGGKRLISILAPEMLFREGIMERLGRTLDAGSSDAPGDYGTAVDGPGSARHDDVVVTFLVVRLDGQEFGLPIGVVDEVAQVPSQVTRVPNTPDFLEGVINLRGEVLPVIDQRRRFGLDPLQDPAGRRLVVVRTAQHRAGLIVDGISEVLRSDRRNMSAAPALTGETTQLVDGVLNLDQAGRIILIVNPDELLTRAEQTALTAFQSGAADSVDTRAPV